MAATTRFEKSISFEPTQNTEYSDYHMIGNGNQLDDLFHCSYCYELYDINDSKKLPKTLPNCLHSFCAACLDRCLNSSLNDNESIFKCPICQTKQACMNSLVNLPINNEILKIIEMRNRSPRSNQIYHAACPSCKNIKTLEICFECRQPICKNCLENHFGAWKEDLNKKINKYENDLSECLSNIEILQPTVDSNLKNIKKLEAEINYRHDLLIKELNSNKEKLLDSLKNAKTENEDYIKFKQSMKQTVLNLKKTKSEIQKYEKSEMETRKQKITQLDEEFNNTQSDYNEFYKRPFNELREELILNSIIGSLNVKEISLVQKRSASPIISNAFHLNSANLYQDLSNLKGNSPTRKSDPLKQIINSEDSLKKFINSSEKEPDWELPIDHIPSHISNYENLLFVCDDYGTLSLFEISSGVLCKKVSTQKLNFTNIRNISVNSKYLGVTYSCLQDRDIKKYNKKLPINGICLFNRKDNKVCSDLTSFIKSNSKGGYISPRGLVLGEEHIFVSDKDKRKVYKLNYDGDVIQKYKFDGRPFDISLNSKFLVATDSKSHEIYLIDIEKMSLVKKITVDQVNKFDEGPHHIQITNDNLIFLNNATNTEIYLHDPNLNYKASFSVKFSKILNMSLLNSPNQSLIIGSKTNNNKYKLSCFIPK